MVEGGAAHEYGNIGVGDVLRKVDGYEVSTVAQAKARLAGPEGSVFDPCTLPSFHTCGRRMAPWWSWPCMPKICIDHLNHYFFLCHFFLCHWQARRCCSLSAKPRRSPMAGPSAPAERISTRSSFAKPSRSTCSHQLRQHRHRLYRQPRRLQAGLLRDHLTQVLRHEEHEKAN